MSVVAFIASMVGGIAAEAAPAADPVIEVPEYFGYRTPGSASNVYSGKTAVLIGDSITRGYGLGSLSDRWSTKLCTALSMTESNFGVDSSTLQKRDPVNPFGATNMLDRLSSIPTYTSSYGLLTFAFGMNDWRVNSVNYNDTNFKEDYNTVLANAYSKGWPKDKIVLIAPSYPNNTPINAVATRVRIQNLVQDCIDLIYENEINGYNPYAAMLAEDYNSLLNADGVHPNSTGHTFMSTVFQNLLNATL